MLRSLTQLLIIVFAIYDGYVLGTVVLESPSHRTLTVGTDVLLLECEVWTGEGVEQVTELTWARQWPYEDDFKDILQIPLSSDGDKKPFYRDFSLKRRTNISVSTEDAGKIKVTVQIEPDCTDEALYRCDVTVVGGSSPPAKVTNITIVEDPLILSLTQGGRFECVAVLGNPPGKLVWVMVRRQGARLHNVTMGGMMTQRTDQPYCSRVVNSVLTAQVSEEDESIICAVIRGDALVHAEKEIVVPFAVKKATISGTIGGRDIRNSPRQVSAVVGQSVVLNCSARGRPEPVVKWQHWGSTTWLELDQATDALILPDVDSSVEGRYQCEAENYVGGARHRQTTEIFLRVKQSLDDEPQLKDSSHKVTLVIIFIVVVVVILSIALCVLIAFGRRRHHKRAKRKHKPIYNVEMAYRPIVKNTARRSFTVPPPLLADDDFRI